MAYPSLIFTVRIGSPEGCNGTVVELNTPSTSKASALMRDKSIGLVLLGLWLVMNIGLVMSLLGSLSGYLLPLTLLIIGIILYWFAKR